ncbi:DUF6527 family protein [Pseudomonas aeruginosa]|uniref:DUF6527 family protein n=1 Tax=Pseudomonas aeruginosa TaxID=287 RepID=UPI003306E600
MKSADFAKSGSLFQSFPRWFGLRLRTYRVEGDILPAHIRPNQLIHLVDDGESWSAGFLCPCGCGDVLEVALIKGARQRWSLSVDGKGRPTLYPSIWRTTGCRSHFERAP